MSRYQKHKFIMLQGKEVHCLVLCEFCTKMLPMATNLTSKVLLGLATGELNSLCNFGKDKILGQGLYQKTSQRGGFPHSLE